VSAEDQARAWFTLGEACRALGQKGEAENAYFKCWEFSASPYSYRARYQVAVDRIEEKKLDEAEEILGQNLKVLSPNLDREAHEKSLYLLASLLYQRGDFAKASLWLENAIRNYPDNAQVYVARDLLGDSFHQLGAQLQKEIDKDKNTLPATALVQLKKDKLDRLEKSAHVYEHLADDLKSLKDRQPLTAAQEKLFRKAAFTRADLELEMENYLEALRRYQILAELYTGQFEELIACHRIWLCCTALQGQPKHYGQALDVVAPIQKSAQANLANLPEELFQGTTKTWSRQNWQTFLAGIEAQLKKNSSESLKPAP
jgi:tetratricopeptide (TPR) repeat protein